MDARAPRTLPTRPEVTGPQWMPTRRRSPSSAAAWWARREKRSEAGAWDDDREGPVDEAAEADDDAVGEAGASNRPPHATARARVSREEERERERERISARFSAGASQRTVGIANWQREGEMRRK